jgi:L-alanine-DL-glutamate epimerase-like enolase superfamily enzyme
MSIVSEYERRPSSGVRRRNPIEDAGRSTREDEGQAARASEQIGTVADVRAKAVRVPLLRPWGPDVAAVHVVACRVITDDGRVGEGFSWTPQIGARAVLSLLRHEIRDAVIGLPAHPEAVWDRLWWHLHEGGGGGLTTIAMAGVDLALWDLIASEAGRTLADQIGRRRDQVPVYGSGVNFYYPLGDLCEQAERWRDRGFRAVKVKVGSPELARDLERVRAVREIVGPGVLLMIDANQRWNLPAARRAIAALAEFDLYWVEEPLPSDDVEGYLQLRAAVDVPIAMGENVYTAYQFRDLLNRGACDIVQPNVVRVGGITPFLRIAELAATFDIPVAPHLLIELSGQLACCLPLPTMVEEVEDASFAALGLLPGPSPIVLEAGQVSPRGSPGLGLQLNLDPFDDLDQPLSTPPF